MVLFVEQDGGERSQEIDLQSMVDARELFRSAVEAGKSKADLAIQKKERALEQHKTIEISGIVKAARFGLLDAREKMINQVFDEAYHRLIGHLQDKTFYRKVLQRIVFQALCKAAGEAEVGLRVVARDAPLVELVLPLAIAEYQELSGSEVRVQVDGSTFLPDISLGGVKLFARQGRILVENTMCSRLVQVRSKFLAFARQGLFGPNPRRRFLD